MMDAARWKQIDELLDAALEIETDKRAAFLNEACGGDEELLKEVESLLASDENEHGRIQAFPKKLAADLLEEQRSVMTSGEFIGPYKILSMIGSGGMGEVYRASDPRIGRDVAIKILPSHFSQDPDRLRRFEQEARAAGMLNHPNIVAIYEAGTNNGSPYLASELLQGEVLQQKLKGRPLPVRKAVDYGLQIAKGLSAAHEKGIVHRDLKPANIFITKEGTVKILDFGLAKLTHPESANLSTILENSDQTETGVVLGTTVYMSPEQVTGRKVDRRSDIFAYGSVLFEMLSGKRPFGGETQIEIMHAILKADPPELSQSNENIPPSLERIVRRCLEKNPDHRFQTTSDLAFALDSLSSTSGTALQPLRQKNPIQFAWILSAILFVAATILGVALYRSSRISPESPSSAQHLSIVLPPNTVLNSSAISPDGKHLAYVINGTTGFSSLWLRSMDSNQAQEIPETEDATLPFWSPDSRSIGFFTSSALKKWTIGGGRPQDLWGVEIAKGGTWNQYGDILFAPKGLEGIYRISAQGGEATLVTRIDHSRGETRHVFPQFLPDGRHFFYLVRTSPGADTEGVYLASLDSKKRKLILPEPTPVRLIDTGYLFFARNGKLMVQPFDKKNFELTAEPIAIADDWSWYVSGPDFSISENNILVYGNELSWHTQPIWFDRTGKQSSPGKDYPSVLGEPGVYSFCDLTSDDRRLLTNWNGPLFMVDLLTGSFVRHAMANENDFILSPDGSMMVYAAAGDNLQDEANLYMRPFGGTGKAELLFDPEQEYFLGDFSWSADGRFITFTAASPKTSFDLWAVPLTGERKPFPYLKTEAREESAVLSPDGKWVAYQSYQTGRSEVLVSRFPPDGGGLWAISTDGGEGPRWRRDGKELFYLTLDKKLMATEVQIGEIFQPGITRFLFQMQAQPRINPWGIGSATQYFVSSDGTHFLVNALVDQTEQPEISVVTNWKPLLKK